MLVQQTGGLGRRASEEHLRQDGRKQRRTTHPGRIPEGLFAGRGTVQNAGTLRSLFARREVFDVEAMWVLGDEIVFCQRRHCLYVSIIFL